MPQQSFKDHRSFSSSLPTMSNTTDSLILPHVALFPSAGMGHLNPFLRLAAMLSSNNCLVTLITPQPTVSAAESAHISFFLSTHPKIKQLEFHVFPYHPPNPTSDDPFYIQFKAISRSVHLLHPLLSSLSPPLSSIFSDLAVASNIDPVATDLCIPNYIVITTSAKFLSLMACLPKLISDPATFSNNSTEVELPGVSPVPILSIPPPLFNPDHIFTQLLVSNCRFLPKAAGIQINTFECFEPETLAALNNGRVLNNLPPIFPIGPLLPYELEKDEDVYLPWLDCQPEESVVYVSFGSRTAMSKEQIRELANGMERSGCRFLWVLKTSKVDKDDKEELKDLLGGSFLERTKNKGMIVKGWVNQEEILSHPSIGGFINHCGWNSVMEVAWRGIPVLAWPQHGDQKVNANVLKKAGLGIWENDWSWSQQSLVKGEEIGKKIEELMRDEKLRGRARKVGEEARKACGNRGGSKKVLLGLVELLKQKMKN